jgi:hypothetical protein
MKVIKIIGAIIGAILTYLVTIIFLPVLRVKRQPHEIADRLELTIAPECRSDVKIIVDGEAVSGWFYKPIGADRNIPCVILSHGFGATKDMVLEEYALKYVKAGFAAITYDYRHYGESEGMPRQIYHGLKQIADLKGVVMYAKNRPEIDSKRIFLWGTSAGGSYGIIAASQDPDIAGVIAQCGAYDHKEDSKTGIERDGWGFYLKLFIHAQRDKGRSRFGLSRHMIPAYGKPATLAFIRGEEIYKGVSKLAKNSKTFRNEICAGFMLMPQAPDVLEASKDVRCPVLVQVCEKDEIVSPRSHIRLIENLGHWAALIKYPIGHFDIYCGEDFEQAVNDQIEFIKKNI